MDANVWEIWTSNRKVFDGNDLETSDREVLNYVILFLLETVKIRKKVKSKLLCRISSLIYLKNTETTSMYSVIKVYIRSFRIPDIFV